MKAKIERIKQALKSVRVRLFITLSVVILLIILFLILVNNFVFGQFYLFSKTRALKDVYNTVNNYYNNEENEDYSIGSILESDNNVEWKPLKELPKYEISTLGSVRSLKTGKTIAYVTDRKEPSVRLLVDEKTRSRKRFLVAKLLLETFIEPQPNEYSTVGFKDGNNQNIDLSNLFWVSNDVHKVAQKSEPKTGDGLSSDKKKTSPIVSKLKKSTSKLDDIDDSDFYKEMEAKSKQRFKDELLRRLNDVK